MCKDHPEQAAREGWMSVFETLTPQELAQQLSHPDGARGLEVADTLGAVNREGNVGVVGMLDISPGDQVLEVGCGLGSMAGVVVGAADAVRYAGLDRSETMIEAALLRHADLVQSGFASFHLAEIEHMPFEAGCFTKVFSIGVIHFWPDPVRALAELRRVMRPDALMVMGALGPDRAPPFAIRENGFHLHTPDEWKKFGKAAGLSEVDVQIAPSTNGPQGIVLSARA